MDRDGKREQIMQAAERLFTNRRLHEITLDDIVREAHVGKGTIYNYFKDKDDLFFQVATRGFDELVELLHARVSDDAPFERQLEQACEAVTAFFGSRRQLFRMIQTEDARMSLCHGKHKARWFQRRKPLGQAMAAIIERGQRDGLVRGDVSSQTLAMLLLGMLRTRGRNLREEGIELSDKLLVDVFLGGAGKPVRRGRLTSRKA